MIDVRLLEGLEREVTLSRVSELGSGHYVGGLGWDDYCDNMDADNKNKRVQV